jgi:hypothetical protein
LVFTFAVIYIKSSGTDPVKKFSIYKLGNVIVSQANTDSTIVDHSPHHPMV